MTSKCVSTSGTWSDVSMAWSGCNQLFEEAFIRDFDSPSPDANLRAIRNIRNFITANPINKRIVVQNDLIRGRVMSLTTAFSTTADYSTTFKREFLCMYASFLHESSTFTEDICKQERFLNDLLNAVNLECEGTSPALREAIMLFLKTLFEADNLDQDIESLPIFKKTTALEIFTSNRLSELICLSEALSGALRRGDKGTRVGAEANTLVCLTKLLALLASHAELAERGGMALLRMAHRNVMVTACPRHAPLVSQDRGLILTFDLANSAPCPDATAHAVARFSLKILFFAIYHLPSHFAIFKNVICETDPRSLISIYTHLSQPYSRCYLGCRNKPPISRRRETNSDPLIYRPIGRSFEGAGDEPDECENEEEVGPESEVDSLSFCSVDGAFGLSGTADRVMCLLVGLLRGVLFWRCCCPSAAETPNAPTVVIVRDRFGNDTVRADGLGLSDDEIALKILQPLTQNSLPLNGTGVNTWACHVMVLVLKQRRSLHSHLLYSQLLTPDFDDTASCLLKALQPTRNYEEYGDFLEQLIPFSRLFACLASTCEDVRFRVGQLSMIRALVQMFVTHPSLTTSPSIASLNLTLSVCQLLHGLSRSMALLHTLFSDASIADCLIELCDRLLPTLPSNPIHEEIVLAASSTLVNLQLCQLPELNTPRVKCIDTFHSLVRVGDGSQQAETKLSLRLNGVWGLANAAAIAASNCLANRMETIERLDAVTIIPEVISLCDVLLSTLSPSHNCDGLQADENKETKLLFETSGPILNSKPSYTHLKSYLLQHSLLLLRNMLALKEVQITEYSENIFSLLARVLSCNTAAIVKYEGLVVLANLLTNSDARSQFWYQSELIQSLATTITTDAEVSILCGAILVVVNILEAPTPVATSVGGDSPGELFTHILSLLLFDDSRSYHGSHKGPSSSSSSSWCRRSSLRSSRRRSVATNTAITPSSSPSRKSPESSVGTVELSTPPTMEAEPHDKPLLHLLGSFIDLFSVYSDSGASVSNVLAAGASTKKQVFREVWDWQCQCGRGGDVEDEQPRRRRGKRFTNVTVSTIASLQYHNSGLLHRQESKFTLAKGITDAAGAAGGLKSLLASLLKGVEGEDASASPPRRTETAAGDAISEEGELEGKLE